MALSQWHFDFMDWQEAFVMFYRKKAQDASYCLLISTNPHVSGYWIERDAEPDAETHVYLSLRSVRELEVRIKTAQEAKAREIGGKTPLSLGRVIL